MSEKKLKTCSNGHQFFKSSDCPVCPICEADRKPSSSFLDELSSPARRALENNGITSLGVLSTYSISEILSWHGMGKTSIPKLERALNSSGLTFKKELI